MAELIIEAIGQTAGMVFFSSLFAIILGFIPAIVLIMTHEDGLKPNKVIYNILDWIINIVRSFPFIILLVYLMPVTRVIVGTTLGVEGAIVPLTIGSIPFVARVIESALKEVDSGIIEAAKSFGASNFQIIFKVMLKEAIPSIISGLTLTVISIIGYSAMAGTVGAGGLGDLAIRYGYMRRQEDVMMVTVIILIIIVQVLQSTGNYLYKKLNK